jgi:hypothetical protein
MRIPYDYFNTGINGLADKDITISGETRSFKKVLS